MATKLEEEISIKKYDDLSDHKQEAKETAMPLNTLIDSHHNILIKAILYPPILKMENQEEYAVDSH
jgi:hypothetical protein